MRALSVGIDGDISFNNNNMESNLNNSVYKASDLIFQTAVNVPKGYLSCIRPPEDRHDTWHVLLYTTFRMVNLFLKELHPILCCARG